MNNVEYTAYFVDKPSELKQMFPPVYPNVYYHHITIEFRPKNVSDIQIGAKKKVRLMGRLTTDKVDALLVDGVQSKNEYPHITLSTANGVKPFASNAEIKNNLDKVKSFDKLIYIDTTKGYMMNGKEIKENSIKLKGLIPEDMIPGGKADNMPAKDFDKKELAMGMKVEMEHTNDKQKAREIAEDHLTEDPHYYTKLKKAGLADELDESAVGDMYIQIGELIESIDGSYKKLDKILSEMFSDKNGIVSHFQPEIRHLMDIGQGLKGLKKDFSDSYDFGEK